jgi:membrane-bound lytic murein transglycosylase C
MNSIFLTTSLVCILFHVVQGKSQDSFEEYKQQQQQALSELANEETAYLEAVTREYDAYLKQEMRQFEIFKDKVEQKWNDSRYSTSKEWVEYDDDLNGRTSIDFEKGEIVVEVIVDDSKNENGATVSAMVSAALENKVTKLIAQKSDDKKLIIQDQIKDHRGKTVSAKKLTSFAKETVARQKVTKTSVKANDGVNRIKYSIKLKMIPNHVEVRANRYKVDIIKQSKRFNIDPAIAFAIMQTESSFNPKARSHIPAYGLMQLVPKSGARDAYRYVYKKDKLLSGNYLYNASNNIELGCAYIAKLRHVYFKGVKDEKTAYYLTIAAYNTGAGNVAKALTGGTKLGPTVVIANKYSSEKIYKLLQRKLPYKETKHYLDKVTGRIGAYQNMIKK